MPCGLWKSTCYIFNKTALSVLVGPCVTSPHQVSSAEVPTPVSEPSSKRKKQQFLDFFQVGSSNWRHSWNGFHIYVANLANFEDLVLNYQQRCSLHPKMFLESCFGKLLGGESAWPLYFLATILSCHLILQIDALEEKGPTSQTVTWHLHRLLAELY